MQIDERVLRTRNSIAHAVIRLGQEQGVDRLTVGQLSREAGISRSTFYSHFGSLEHYLAQSFATMVEGCALHEAGQAGPGDRRLLHVRMILDHAASAPRYAAQISKSRHRPAMLLAGEDSLSSHVERRLQMLRPALSGPDRSVLARFVAAGFIGLFRDWMTSGMKRSPETVERQFGALIAPL